MLLVAVFPSLYVDSACTENQTSKDCNVAVGLVEADPAEPS